MTELEDRDSPQNLYNAVISACEQSSRWREVGSLIPSNAWTELDTQHAQLAKGL